MSLLRSTLERLTARGKNGAESAPGKAQPIERFDWYYTYRRTPDKEPPPCVRAAFSLRQEVGQVVCTAVLIGSDGDLWDASFIVPHEALEQVDAVIRRNRLDKLDATSVPGDAPHHYLWVKYAEGQRLCQEWQDPQPWERSAADDFYSLFEDLAEEAGHPFVCVMLPAGELTTLDMTCTADDHRRCYGFFLYENGEGIWLDAGFFRADRNSPLEVIGKSVSPEAMKRVRSLVEELGLARYLATYQPPEEEEDTEVTRSLYCRWSDDTALSAPMPDGAEQPLLDCLKALALGESDPN